MKLDLDLDAHAPYDGTVELSRAAEQMGFGAVWCSENAHDAFLPLVPIALGTSHVQLGTRVAIAFARTPMNMAYLAWDLQYLSRGRFILGLGTQVKGHIQRRFNMPWESPAPKMKEIVQALRAIWDCWQNGTPLNFGGRFYSFTLMPPIYTPRPIEHPHIPIYISAVNRLMCRVAGEVCDGIHIHPFHTIPYLKEVVVPEVEEGARRAGRSLRDVAFVVPVMVATGNNQSEMEAAKRQIKRSIGFYGSTRTYTPFMEFNGWGELVPVLHRMSLEGKWEEMVEVIPDAMVEETGLVCPPDEIGRRVRERYSGLADRVIIHRDFVPRQDDAFWKELLKQLAA